MTRKAEHPANQGLLWVAEAVADFRKATELQPKLADAFMRLGQAEVPGCPLPVATFAWTAERRWMFLQSGWSDPLFMSLQAALKHTDEALTAFERALACGLPVPNQASLLHCRPAGCFRKTEGRLSRLLH